MDRKNISSILDEAVSQLDHEVSVLKTQKQTLTVNIQELESKRDKISQEIMNLESKHKDTLKKCQDEAGSIIEQAKNKLGQANAKDTKASIGLAELNEKTVKVDNLISSNEGLKKNLEILTMEADRKIARLNNILKVVKEVLDEV